MSAEPRQGSKIETPGPTPGSAEWYGADLARMSDADLLATARRTLVRNYRTAVKREMRARGLEASR